MCVGRSKGDTWWWNEEANEAVSRKIDAHRAICLDNAEWNKRRYEGMKNKALKIISKVMREKVKEALAEFKNCKNWVLRLVRGLQTDSKGVEGGRCMRGMDGKLCFSEEEGGEIWKDYVERIMHDDNDFDYNVEAGAVEGPVVCASGEEVLQALNELKTVIVPRPSKVSLDLVAASGGVEIQVLAEICQKVLDGFGMLAE